MEIWYSKNVLLSHEKTKLYSAEFYSYNPKQVIAEVHSIFPSIKLEIGRKVNTEPSYPVTDSHPSDLTHSIKLHIPNPKLYIYSLYHIRGNPVQTLGGNCINIFIL